MVQENVLEQIESDDVIVHVVWTPVLQLDDYAAAVSSHKKYLQDTRTIHYWDGDQDLGMLYGKILALPSGRNLAWDIYFVFEPGTRWAEKAPVPTDWAHQLGRDERHLGEGENYRSAVEKLLREPIAVGGE